MEPSAIDVPFLPDLTQLAQAAFVRSAFSANAAAFMKLRLSVSRSFLSQTKQRLYL